MMTLHHRHCHCRPRRLDNLTDAQLHAILVRVQTLLLDRPHDGARLAVDLLYDDEARLLALYRALAPAWRREALAYAERAWPTVPAAAPASLTHGGIYAPGQRAPCPASPAPSRAATGTGWIVSGTERRVEEAAGPRTKRDGR